MPIGVGTPRRFTVKPAQWAAFDSVGKEEDDLIDDLDALAGLEAVGAAEPSKKSMTRTYRFPPQETKLRGGKSATVPVFDGPPATISIEALDRTAREITVKAGPTKAYLLTDRLTLHPDWPLNTDVIADALRDVIADQCGPRRFNHHIICYCAMINYAAAMAAPTTAQDADCKACISPAPSKTSDAAKGLAMMINEFGIGDLKAVTMLKALHVASAV